jgi:hypothetical protein
MATIDRIRVPWSGGRGGPGVSTFYCLDAATGLVAVRTFFDAVKAFVASGISWSFFGAGDTLVAETGILSGEWQATGQTTVTSTGSALSSADPVGAMITWKTGAVLFGHRIVGRTFLVPSPHTVFSSGTLDGPVQATLTAAAETMIDAVPGNFVVWSRPKLATPSWTDVRGVQHPARAGHDGAVAPISSAFAPDKAVVLRSRRD